MERLVNLKPRRPVRLRCHNCGSRAEVELSELELQSLREQGSVRRLCRDCTGFSPWGLLEADKPALLSCADREEQDQFLGRVLLIDDDPNILTILKKVLGVLPLDLATATSARAAITRLAREDYDVIFSDIRMPEFDGKQLFQFLDHHMPEHKGRVIFLTGDTGNAETMQFLEDAHCPYLTKPVDMAALFDSLHQFLPQACSPLHKLIITADGVKPPLRMPGRPALRDRAPAPASGP